MVLNKSPAEIVCAIYFLSECIDNYLQVSHANFNDLEFVIDRAIGSDSVLNTCLAITWVSKFKEIN